MKQSPPSLKVAQWGHTPAVQTTRAQINALRKAVPKAKTAGIQARAMTAAAGAVLALWASWMAATDATNAIPGNTTKSGDRSKKSSEPSRAIASIASEHAAPNNRRPRRGAATESAAGALDAGFDGRGGCIPLSNGKLSCRGPLRDLQIAGRALRRQSTGDAPFNATTCGSGTAADSPPVVGLCQLERSLGAPLASLATALGAFMLPMQGVATSNAPRPHPPMQIPHERRQGNHG